MKTADYKKVLIQALKRAGTYSRGLDSQIEALAGVLRTLEIANNEIDSLEVTTVMETTRYGEKMAPHPAFKVQRDAQDAVTRQMKALGLTATDLATDAAVDPLVNLTKKVAAANNKRVITVD